MKINIPEKNKRQIAQAIMGLVTALLLLGANVGGQFVYQLLGLAPEPVPVEDQLIALGVTHFSGMAIGTGTPGTAAGDNDLYVTGDFEVDNIIVAPVDVENIGLPSVVSADIVYSTATGAIATVGDGEIWIVHNVYVQTTTNFDCTGDDCTLTVGDGNDADGFINAADANIQATFTEATGYAAGWFGLENGSNGAYTVDEGSFVYAPSGAAETIDYAIGGTSPAAGAATVYVVYTRIQ